MDRAPRWWWASAELALLTAQFGLLTLGHLGAGRQRLEAGAPAYFAYVLAYAQFALSSGHRGQSGAG